MLGSTASPTTRGMGAPLIQPLPNPEQDGVVGPVPVRKQKFAGSWQLLS
jgi:hypothetical protein